MVDDMDVGPATDAAALGEVIELQRKLLHGQQNLWAQTLRTAASRVTRKRFREEVDDVLLGRVIYDPDKRAGLGYGLHFAPGCDPNMRR